MSIRSFKEVVSRHADSAFEKHLLSAMDNDDCVFFNFIETYPGFLGYHPNYNGKIYLAEGFPNLWHEISHLIEIDEERFMIPDFGLGKAPNKSQQQNKKYLINVLAREERVAGIEHIIHFNNLDFSAKRYQPIYNSTWTGWFNDAGYPNFKFKNHKEVKDWGTHVFETSAKNWTRDKIEHIFFKRIEALRNNLHSQK